MEDPPPSAPGALQRQNSTDREEYLLSVATHRSESREEISFQEGWDICKTYGIDVVAKILSSGMAEHKPFGNRGYSALYTISFSMCAQANASDHSATIYTRINESIEEFLRDHVMSQIMDSSVVGYEMMNRFSTAWENQKIMTKWIQMLFRHLDKGYVHNNSLPTLTSCGMSKFLEVAFGGTSQRVRAAVLELIDRERDGEVVDRSKLRTCIEVFMVMGITEEQESKSIGSVKELMELPPKLRVYRDEFEAYYIASTTDYYSKHGQVWRDDFSVADYLARCEKVLEAEKGRIREMLHSSSETRVMEAVQRTLLSEPQIELIERPQSGMYAMLNEGKGEDLHRMHKLFCLPGVSLGETPMSELFEKYVCDHGTEAIQKRESEIKRLEGEGKKEPASDTKLILSFIDLYRSGLKMVANFFSNSVSFQQSLSRAFQTLTNHKIQGKYSLVELLVAFADSILKGKEGSDKLDEALIEDRVEKIMEIFNFVQDKDLFAELFRDLLCKRLLNKKSVSMEMEKLMISKMKYARGTQFTLKIEGMVRDHQMIADGVRQYHEYLEQQAEALPCEASVQVLTQGFWPAQRSYDFHLTGAFVSIISSFSAYYESLNSGKKKLTWVHTLGDAEVRGVFPKGTYGMNTTTLQAATLCKVAEVGRATTKELVDLLGWDIEFVKRVLHSLSCGRAKVLKKTGPGDKGKIHENDSFAPNAEFTSKTKKFSIPMASLDNVNKQIKERVKEDRSFAIDAALVRIMKARKLMSHQELIAEVVSQLTQFKPELPQVKKRIESLIERDYLQRVVDEDGNFTREYKYLA